MSQWLSRRSGLLRAYRNSPPWKNVARRYHPNWKDQLRVKSREAQFSLFV
jgi:hypothetical protein